jgi:hypothetical protein
LGKSVCRYLWFWWFISPVIIAANDADNHLVQCDFFVLHSMYMVSSFMQFGPFNTKI